MRTTRIFVASAILTSAILASACGDSTLSSPSAPPTPPFVPPDGGTIASDVWDVAVRLTDATGGECVGDTMRSQIGVPKPYSLSIVRNGANSVVTLKSASGDLFCTYPVVVEGNAFSTSNGRFYTCEPFVMKFTCDNGLQRQLVSFGQSISGEISGSAIAGRWGVDWIVKDVGDIADLSMTAEYSGQR